MKHPIKQVAGILLTTIISAILSLSIVHAETITKSGTWTCTKPGTYKIVVIGGGAGGSNGSYNEERTWLTTAWENEGGTGGGAGAVVTKTLHIAKGTYNISIGAGGAAAANTWENSKGSAGGRSSINLGEQGVISAAGGAVDGGAAGEYHSADWNTSGADGGAGGTTGYTYGNGGAGGRSYKTNIYKGEAGKSGAVILTRQTDTTPPTSLTVSCDDTEWTASKTISAEAIDEDSEVSETDGYGWSCDGTNWEWGPNTYTVTKPGTYYVKARNIDNIETESTETIYIEKIDNQPPTLNDISESGWSNNSVTLTVDAGDIQADGTTGSGIRGYQFGSDAEQTSNTWTFSGSEGASIPIKIWDNAGRVTETTYTITHIDKTSPDMTISKTIGGVTAATDSTIWAKNGQSVAITITASDAKSGVYEYTLDGNTWSPWPKSDGVNPDTFITLTYNTSTDTVLKINVRDLAGNPTLETPQQVPVRIDHDAPVITSATQTPSDGSEWVTVSGNQWTSKDVKITIESADTGGSGDPEARYSFDGGSTWQTENWFITSTMIF